MLADMDMPQPVDDPGSQGLEEQKEAKIYCSDQVTLMFSVLLVDWL